MEASTDNPQYKQAVYEAYGRQMPELMDTIGARDYDDLMDKAYRQLNYETDRQFNQMPVNMSFHRAGEGDYRSSKEMLEDVHGNQHLYVFQGGEPHNMMSDVDPRTGLNQTEKFRAVHDLFGHAVHGNEFGPKGEELAFGAHSQMYSPLARIALATETRGQNSVVNYTPLNVELKSELAKLDALRYEAMRRGDEGLANEIAQQKRALYGENFQYSPNRGLLLPPEFTDPMFEGGLPEYMSGIFRPSQGTSERLTHFSHDPSLTVTDPSRYGTGIRGEEMYRLQGSKAPVMDRTYFYRGEEPRPESGLGQYRYGTQGENLYSMSSDPERLGLLAREANRMPFTARSNQGLVNEDQALTDFERLAKEYGYEGLLGNRAGIMYNPAAVERYADGGEVHMMGGGRPPKKTTLEEDLKSFKDPAMALADLFAGAGKGTAAAATGIYGDMEELLRKYGQGIPANIVRLMMKPREGAKTTYPTIEEMNAMLPPVVPAGAGRSAQVADVGQFLGQNNPLAPAAGELGIRAVKAAAPYVARGALDLANSRPMQEAVEQLGNITGTGPMYAVPKDKGLPLRLARANPKTTAELRAIAERVGRQMNNEHVTSPLGGTTNLAGRSKKESERLQNLNYVVEKDPAIKPPNIYNPKLGDVLMANPGDQTISDSILKSIEELGLGDIPIDSPQQGGSRFSLGTIARDPKKKRGWWASGPGPSKSIQDKGVRLLEQLNLPGKVIASHLAMGPISNNYAMHMADANLKATGLSNVSDEAANYFDDIIKGGTEVKGVHTYFPNWPGIKNPQAAYQAMLENPEMRKWYQDRMKTPSVTQPLGIPNGLDVQWAVTEPDFRNLEVNMTGHTMGELDPYAPLMNEDWHNTYEKRIPLGGRVGRQKVLTPFSLSFPDATEHILSTQRPKDFTGTIQKVFPHQVVDDQWINEVNEYARMLKQITGKKEGGEVHMDKGGAAKDAVKAAVKEAAEGLRSYIDPISKRISDWNWRPMSDVRQDVPLTEVPEYIQKGYGDFMSEQAKRAAAGDLNARDLIKAYTITRSSVNRGGLPYNTATKTGMQLPRTTEKLVRPEGAFSEWLGSRAGQRYLDDAVLGKFDEKDLADLVTRFSPFGMPAVLADDLRYAARTLSPKGATISSDVVASPEQYRKTSQELAGIGPAKSGFMASLLGRGDFPTFDARQINLHTGEGGKQAKKYLARGYGEGGEEAVARLADRQRAMNMSIDPALAPFYQHLTHHTVWDALDNSQVTHNDLMKAMRGYADGGEVDSDGVTLDEFLKNQGY
jgi:hypothetical protein